MYQVGQEEIDAIARVIRSQALFRHGVGNECEKFEARYAEYYISASDTSRSRRVAATRSRRR